MACAESLHESHVREDEPESGHVIEIIESLPVPNDDIEHVENLMNNQLEEAEAGDSQQIEKQSPEADERKKEEKRLLYLHNCRSNSLIQINDFKSQYSHF